MYACIHVCAYFRERESVCVCVRACVRVCVWVIHTRRPWIQFAIQDPQGCSGEEGLVKTGFSSRTAGVHGSSLPYRTHTGAVAGKADEDNCCSGSGPAE